MGIHLWGAPFKTTHFEERSLYPFHRCWCSKYFFWFRFQISDLRGRIRDQNQKSVIRSQLSVYIFFTGERNILRRHFITQNYATFLQRTKVRGGIPDFVKEEFESYLKCGILAHGFLRIPFIKIWKKFEGEYREKAFEVLYIVNRRPTPPFQYPKIC